MLVVYGIGLCERPILMKFDKGGISSNGKNLRALLLLVSFAMFIILQLTGCVDSAGLKSAASIESTLESAESASDSLPKLQSRDASSADRVELLQQMETEIQEIQTKIEALEELIADEKQDTAQNDTITKQISELQEKLDSLTESANMLRNLI